MKRVVVVVFSLCIATSLWGQNVSHEEKVVRTMYYKIGYLSQLGPVSKAALRIYTGDKTVDEGAVNRQADDAAIQISLSNFKTGPMNEILDRKWTDLSTPALPPVEVLDVHIHTQSFKENDAPAVEWQTADARWRGTADTPAQEVVDKALSRTVRQALSDPGVANNDITYTSYAAYTVNLSYQGKSVTYKAMYLFGRNSKGGEQATPGDAVLALSGLSFEAPQDLYPKGLLQSHIRDVPILSNWLNGQDTSK